MSSLFDFGPGHRSPRSKMHISQGALPAYIDASQPPTKRSPWRQITELPFVHTVTMLMPDELYELVWTKIDFESKKVKYAKVIMKLQDILEGEFFTEYIKKGNIIMISEGVAGIDNLFSLREGLLRLELDKESYERAGLQGRPDRSGGRKHVKARYVVEVDLRQPSMLHGKKGFERVVWAAKNVLNQSLVWLFADVSKGRASPGSPLPLDKHQPTCLEMIPNIQAREGVVVPNMLSGLTRKDKSVQVAEDEEQYHELVEWVDLACLRSKDMWENSVDAIDVSPDRIDPPETLRVLSLQGLISPEWLTQMLIKIITFSRSQNSAAWLAISATSHGIATLDHTDGYSVILTPSQPTDEDPRGSEVDSTQPPRSQMGKSWQKSGLQQFLVYQIADTLDTS